MKGVFRKIGVDCLVPVDDEARRIIQALKLDEGIELDFRTVRNLKFHRKFFAVLKLGFEAWEPPDKEDTVKDFDFFREEVLCLAKHCKQVYSLDGKTFKLKARSISFAKCSQERFEVVYRNVLDVIWSHIMKDLNYRDPEHVEQIALQLLRFD